MYMIENVIIKISNIISIDHLEFYYAKKLKTWIGADLTSIPQNIPKEFLK